MINFVKKITNVYKMLKNKHISLRPIELEDLNILYKWENNPNLWEVSNTIVPFSKYILEKYLENSHLDIFTTKQIRFVIEENESKKAVGLIDIFDFEPMHNRAGIGILIYEENDRQNGFAYNALELIKNYASQVLMLNQIYCDISEDNTASIKLFKKSGFKISGKKEKWIKTPQGYKDELFLQFIF